MLIVEVVATVLVIVGVYLISIPNIGGQYIMAMSQVLWFIFGLSTGHVWLAIQSAVLFILALVAIHRWSDKWIGTPYKHKQ
jgi:hypothetical protein